MYSKKQLINLTASLSSAFVMVFLIVNIGSLCRTFDPTTSSDVSLPQTATKIAEKAPTLNPLTPPLHLGERPLPANPQQQETNPTSPPPIIPTFPPRPTPDSTRVRPNNGPIIRGPEYDGLGTPPNAREAYEKSYEEKKDLPENDTRYIQFSRYYSQPGELGLDPAWIAEVEQQPKTDNPRDVVLGLIQFRLPFDTYARHELEKMGATFYGVSFNGGALYVGATAAILPKLKELADAKRVLYAGYTVPLGKIRSHLWEEIHKNPTSTIRVSVYFFLPPTADQVQEVLQFVEPTLVFTEHKSIFGYATIQDIMALSELLYIESISYSGGGGTTGSLESRMITGSDWVQWQRKELLINAREICV